MVDTINFSPLSTHITIMTNQSNRRPLMGTSNILGKQNNGFKNTAWAIAEIVDNSIQAGASGIQIVFVARPDRNNKVEEILIIDDGEGMSRETFDKALQFGSGTRDKATSGLGKYGQGLPNSSVSQTKRVEVFTSQGQGYLYNYLDLDEIYQSQEPFLPEIEEKNPKDVPAIKSMRLSIPEKGTVVRWVDMNRASPKTISAAMRHTEKLLGRIFRYYIKGFKNSEGEKVKCNIELLAYDYNGAMYTSSSYESIGSVKPFDPLFLTTGTQDERSFPQLSAPFSKRHGQTVNKEFKLPSGEKTKVEIDISYCPREYRDKFGRNAGSTDFGKHYLKRNLPGTSYSNISIVRAHREIDSGHFNFIGDVSKPEHRWWSVEIRFEPILDDILGVDYTKQRADNIKLIDAEEGLDSDDNEIASWISQIIASNITSVFKIIKAPPAPSGKTTQKQKLPEDLETEPGTPTDLEDTDETKKEFADWVKNRYDKLSKNEVDSIVEHALSLADNHLFVPTDLGDSLLYSYQQVGSKVLIEINQSHPFYTRFFGALEGANNPTLLRSFRLLIGSMVHAHLSRPTTNKDVNRDRRDSQTVFGQKLADYIEDVFAG